VRPLEPETDRMVRQTEEQHLRDSVDQAICALIEYCRLNDWAGYDPYDALNSPLFAATPLYRSRIFRLVLTQA